MKSQTNEIKSKRRTIQKQLVYNAVENLNNHANAEQVYQHVISIHPSVSKATVYRNLSQLAESGELIKIGNFYGSTHYDHNCHDHYHFMCEKCLHIYDINSYFYDVEGFTKTDGHEVTGHSLSFFGLCKNCNDNK